MVDHINLQNLNLHFCNYGEETMIGLSVRIQILKYVFLEMIFS